MTKQWLCSYITLIWISASFGIHSFSGFHYLLFWQLRPMLFNDGLSQQGHSASWTTALYPRPDTWRPPGEHSQPGECRWSLKSSSRLSVSMYVLTHLFYHPWLRWHLTATLIQIFTPYSIHLFWIVLLPLLKRNPADIHSTHSVRRKIMLHSLFILL